MTGTMTIRDDDALLLVDVQYDFCPGGALAVTDGDAVVPVLNRLSPRFPVVVATQDWHPADHSSFASRHAGAEPFGSTEMPYGRQTLWPDHCVQGSEGARLHDGLDLARCQLVVRKGFRRDVDSYSAFFENDHETATGLAGYLRERGVRRVFMGGLATDFCVGYSALDGRRQGFEVVVVEDACRAIDLGGSLAAMLAELREAGVVVVRSDAIG